MTSTVEPKVPIALAFLAEGGELGARMRSHDWSTSPLGDPATWPQSLRSVVGLLLGSKFPMFVAWGEELGFLYNDPYAEILGAKHPQALGRRFHDVWSEIWPDISPLIDAAMAGEATYRRDLPLVMNRKGFDEQTWFTFSYSPVRDESGRVAGMFCACTETTGQVLAERESRSSAERFRAYVTASSSSMYRMSPDWSEMRQLDGRGFLSDTPAPRTDWLDAYIHPDDQPHITAAIRKAIAAKGVFDLEHRIRLADGGLGWTHSRAVPVLDERGEVVEWFGAASDVSERRRGEQLRAAQNRVLELAVANAPLAETLDELVRTVEELSSGALASILILDGDGRHLRHGAAPSLPAAYNAAIDGIAVADGIGSCGAAAYRKEPVLVADIASDPLWADFRDLALSHGLRACWSIPIVSAAGAVLGTFAMYYREPRGADPADLELVEFVVTSAALVIERKAAESALRASEAHLTAIFEQSAAGLTEVDGTGRFLRVNDRYCEIVGRTREELLGLRMHDLTHPEDLVGNVPLFERTARGGASFEIVKRYLRPDGAPVWVHDSVTALRGPDGKPASTVCVTIDITDRKRTEEALRASETRLRLASEAGRIGEWELDLATDTSVRALRHDQIFGYDEPVPDWGFDTFIRHVVAEDRPHVEDSFRRSAETGAGWNFECRIRRAGDGDLRWISAHSAPQLDGNGNAVCLFGLVQDITEQRRAEERLREMNETLEARVAETSAELDRAWRLSQDLFGVADRTGYFFRTNPAFERVLGWTAEEVAATPFMEFVHPDDREKTLAALAGLADGVPAILFENRQRHKNGGHRWLSWTAVPEQGRYYCVARDVTGQKDQAAALRLYGDIIQSDDSPIVAFNADHKVTAFNKAHADAFFRVFGHRQAVGDVLPDLFPPDQATVLRGLMNRALAGETFTAVEEFGSQELDKPFFEIGYAPLKDEDGRIIGGFHRAKDISARLRAEAELEVAQEALRQSHKMEAMGQLTGGVAHDFNNLLTPIVGSLDMLQRKGLGGEREQRLIAGAAQSADRAKTLVQRLLAFARRQPLQTVAVDVARLVTGMADLVSSTTGPQIRVVVDAPADLPAAQADPNQLEMALLNLSVNARDAMPEGGTLRISASAESVRPGHRAKLRTGDYICLSVADTGAGMDETTLARAVEPFFSTKGIGKGTGLGLSMVHGLASQLGGALVIQSRPGLGTNAELWLPRSSVAPQPAETAPPPGARPATSGRALLVDDEELVRMSTADMLNDLGYAVVEAASGEEAMRLIDRGEGFDLLVTDHLMPGMNGTELARAVRSARPGVPVLLVSGYAERDGIDPDLPRLTKPFRKDELAASLAQITAPA